MQIRLRHWSRALGSCSTPRPCLLQTPSNVLHSTCESQMYRSNMKLNGCVGNEFCDAGGKRAMHYNLKELPVLFYPIPIPMWAHRDVRISLRAILEIFYTCLFLKQTLVEPPSYICVSQLTPFSCHHMIRKNLNSCVTILQYFVSAPL